MCWLQLSAQLWHYPTFLLPPLIVIAFIECFAGYRAWRFLMGVNGAVLGFVAGAMLCALLGAPMLVLVGALLGAIAGAMLFAGVVPLGTFVVVLGTVVSLVILLGRVAGISSHWAMPVALVVGLAGAIAAMVSCRPAVVVVAAVAGAQQIASAWCAYCLPGDRIPLPEAFNPSEWTAFLFLAAAGMLVQFATAPRTRPDPAKTTADACEVPR